MFPNPSRRVSNRILEVVNVPLLGLVYAIAVLLTLMLVHALFVSGVGVGSPHAHGSLLPAVTLPLDSRQRIYPVKGILPRATIHGSLVYDHEDGRLTMALRGLQPIDTPQAYELWLLQGAHGIVSIGTLRPSLDGKGYLAACCFAFTSLVDSTSPLAILTIVGHTRYAMPIAPIAAIATVS